VIDVARRGDDEVPGAHFLHTVLIA
jgi:hypothetical protein